MHHIFQKVVLLHSYSQPVGWGTWASEHRLVSHTGSGTAERLN